MKVDFEQAMGMGHILPYKECSDCPLAQKVVKKAKKTHPYPGTKETKLDKVALACIVVTGKSTKKNIYNAHVGGIRSDSWINREGTTHHLIKNLAIIEGTPPPICPQIETKKKVK